MAFKEVRTPSVDAMVDTREATGVWMTGLQAIGNGTILAALRCATCDCRFRLTRVAQGWVDALWQTDRAQTALPITNKQFVRRLEKSNIKQGHWIASN